VDSVTHVVIGALMGDAFAGKSLGKKAMIWGAAAQSLPDIDFVASFWLPTTENLLVHRGLTHSLVFGACATVVLSIVCRRMYMDISLKKWLLFFGVELYTHLFLDSFNSYGTGLFEPFDHSRISFNALFVVDPFFSVVPTLVFLALLVMRTASAFRKWLVALGLITCSFYLLYAVENKAAIDQVANENLHDQNIDYTRYFTTPTAFNNWLWYVVAEGRNGYFIGYRSVFDRTDSIHFQYFPRQEVLLKTTDVRSDVSQLLQFSQGYYTVQNDRDTLVFNDLRFGQIMGWTDPKAKFVFHYYLNYPAANDLVIQRGRFTGWTEENWTAFMNRIRGYR